MGKLGVETVPVHCIPNGSAHKPTDEQRQMPCPECERKQE